MSEIRLLGLNTWRGLVGDPVSDTQAISVGVTGAEEVDDMTLLVATITSAEILDGIYGLSGHKREVIPAPGAGKAIVVTAIGFATTGTVQHSHATGDLFGLTYDGMSDITVIRNLHDYLGNSPGELYYEPENLTVNDYSEMENKAVVVQAAASGTYTGGDTDLVLYLFYATLTLPA